MASASSSSQRPINLLRGWPSPDILPVQELKRAADTVLVDASIFVPGLQYGPDPGYQPLREELACWLGSYFNVSPDPNRICITGGASQNIACILQSYTDPAYTQAVWMIAPCYHIACPIFADSGFEGRLKAVPEDDEGIDLEYLEKGLESMKNEPHEPAYKEAASRKLYRHIVYVVPTCANPSGKTMSLSRREGLVRLARKFDCLVVCDDVYDFLQWPTSGDTSTIPAESRLPRLCDIDMAMEPVNSDPKHFGNTVSNGSFSKIVGPGVRTGWVEGTPAFTYGLSQTGSTRSGGAPSQLCATFMCEMIKSGDLERHIGSVIRPALQRRHRLMMQAIHEHLGPLGIKTREASLSGSNIYGGYFVWFSLPEGSPPAKAVFERATKTENLIIGSGHIFEVRGDEASARFEREIRLCYSWEPEADIIEGVRRLGRVLKAMAQDTSWSSGSRVEQESGTEVGDYK